MIEETNGTRLDETATAPNGGVSHTPNVRSHYLNTRDTAAYLGLSPRTLEKHCSCRTGPACRKVGGRIVYSVEEMEARAEPGMRRSTSYPGVGTVHLLGECSL